MQPATPVALHTTFQAPPPPGAAQAL